MKDEWKKHIRELKVLRAKKKAGGWLPPKEAKRLEWLEERFGDAPEIERIQVDEPVDAGPKITTADHGYATEVSEKLLSEAEKYKLKKAWEKDEERKKRAFEARDRREGKATFKQEGLSGFAVEATEDMKEGEIGLAETPQEEEAQQKIQHGQVVYAQDESERLTKKSEGDSSPFALNISDSLTRGLEKHRNYKEETVPDTAAKSFEVEVDDEELAALDNLDRAPTKAEDLSEELQGLLKKSYELPKDEVKSEGEMSTHAVGTSAEEMSTFDLMRQAVDFAETQGTVEEEAQVFEIDEEGKAIPYEDQVEDLTAGMGDTGTGETVEAELPMPPPPPPPEPPKKKHRFSDTAPTRPGVAPSELVTEMGEALPDPAAAEPDDLAVLIPDPTDSLPEEEEILEVDDDEILEVDSDEIIEVEPEIEMEIDHSSQAEVAAAMEPQPRGEDIDVDDFWGAAEDAPPAEPPTIPEQEKPEPPKYRPKKPLPALNVAAQRPAAKRSEAVPIGAPRPAPKPAPKAVDHKEIDALFSEAEIDAGADEEIATIAPAKPKAAKPFAEGTTQPVDLPPGPRKATVHFKDGVTRRGVIGQFDTDADLIRLDPPANSSAPAEDLIALALKTIFLMVPRGASKPRVNGASVRLVLIDGRSLEGVTTDYDPHRKAFTLFPKGARGNIERIIVFNDAVKNIWFD